MDSHPGNWPFPRWAANQKGSALVPSASFLRTPFSPRLLTEPGRTMSAAMLLENRQPLSSSKAAFFSRLTVRFGWASMRLVKRWISIAVLLLLAAFLASCASESFVVSRSSSGFSPFQSRQRGSDFRSGWLYADSPQWMGPGFGPVSTKNIGELSAEERQRLVDTINRVNWHQADPNRGWGWWNQRRYWGRR